MYTTEKFTTDKFTTNVSFYNIVINKAISFSHKKIYLLIYGIKIQFVVNLVYFNTWIRIMFMLMLIVNSVGAQSFYFLLTGLLVKIINNHKNHDLRWFLLCQIKILWFAINHQNHILRGGSSRGPKPIIQMVDIRMEFMIRCPGYCLTKLYQFLLYQNSLPGWRISSV